jgi:hypothetical protein
VGNDNDTVGVPWERSDLCAYSEIIVNTTNSLGALAERGEELSQLFRIHSASVICNKTAVDAELPYGEPGRERGPE